MPKRASEYLPGQMHQNSILGKECVNITSSKSALLSWRFYLFLPSLDRARTS